MRNRMKKSKKKDWKRRRRENGKWKEERKTANIETSQIMKKRCGMDKERSQMKDWRRTIEKS